MRIDKSVTLLPIVMFGGFTLFVGLPFAIFWTMKAKEMGAPFFLVLFGLGFACFLLLQFGAVTVGALAARKKMSESSTGLNLGDSAGNAAYGEARRNCTYCGCNVTQSITTCPNCGADI